MSGGVEELSPLRRWRGRRPQIEFSRWLYSFDWVENLEAARNKSGVQKSPEKLNQQSKSFFALK